MEVLRYGNSLYHLSELIGPLSKNDPRLELNAPQHENEAWHGFSAEDMVAVRPTPPPSSPKIKPGKFSTG